MKILGGLMGSLLLIAGLLLGGLWYYLDNATKAAIELGGEQVLGVATEVGSVRVLPFNGYIRLSDIRIANPEGFSNEAFLLVGSGGVSVNIASLATDQVEISSIALDNLVLRLEKKSARANYESLGTAEAEAVADAAPDRTVVVRRLTLTNVTAYVDGAVHGNGAGDLVVEIPEIALTDVGSGNGMVVEDLSQVVISAIINALVKKGISLPLLLVKSVGVIPVQVTGEVLRSVTDIAGEGGSVIGDVLGGTVSGAGKGVESAAGALRSLFGSGKKDGEAAETE